MNRLLGLAIGILLCQMTLASDPLVVDTDREITTAMNVGDVGEGVVVLLLVRRQQVEDCQGDKRGDGEHCRENCGEDSPTAIGRCRRALRSGSDLQAAHKLGEVGRSLRGIGAEHFRQDILPWTLEIRQQRTASAGPVDALGSYVKVYDADEVWMVQTGQQPALRGEFLPEQLGVVV